MGLVVAEAPNGGWDRDRRLWWLLWAGCPGLGWVSLRGIEMHFGSLAAAWRAPMSGFPSLSGPRGNWRRAVEDWRDRWGAEPLARWSQSSTLGRCALLPGDVALPPSLNDLARPPLALFWKGRGSLWPHLRRRAAVAVVGTRRPSRHGEAMAEAVGRALAQAGWPVISGLADGIDGASHRGCLAQGGSPIAVLGTSLDRVYPSHHAQLQHQVAELGLLISEQPQGTPIRPGHFAARNRLLVQLASAVVLVECPEQSGALHSARLAQQEQLPLWVVPSDAARPSSRGSNRLLAQGARVLLEPSELIRHLGQGPLAPRSPTPVPDSSDKLRLPVVPEDAHLLSALADGACLEQLSQQLQLPLSWVAQRLLALELQGQVRAEPGLHWRRV